MLQTVSDLYTTTTFLLLWTSRRSSYLGSYFVAIMLPVIDMTASSSLAVIC